MAFDAVLVANRGEIAVRVLRASRALGLRTVAVFSDADRDAPHVGEADTALRIGPPPAAESYLSIPALLDAARRSGAGAVHPGYGFLSESAAFARACVEAELTWVGPPAGAIERLGRKDEARRLAVAAAVPVIDAVDDAPDDELAERAARALGFPLMVKAVAGGGGRGMRIVRAREGLVEAIAAARREALAAFGDGALLVERLVERARHVEVQVLADAHGHVVHLGERDCSTQRRHQKVLEEAPAPTIDDALRERLTGAAVRLAREAGYVSAGTVEFMVAGDEAWLLEMNTRLQVEHPVTELVHGLDLVALQLRIAAGEPLPFVQDDLTAAGHAIEARVYAEDPYSGFLPQAGTATAVRWPAGVRVDEALRAGQEVSAFYDPLLGKVIAHGPTREAARAGLVGALDDTAIVGVTTNVGWLRDLADSDPFRDAAIDTAWLDRAAPPRRPPLPEAVRCAAAWALASAAAAPDALADPWGSGDGWRAGGPPAPVTLALEHEGGRMLARVDRDAGTVEIDGTTHAVAAPPSVEADAPLVLDVDGERHVVHLWLGAHGVTAVHRGHVHLLRPPGEAAGEATVASHGEVAAPMPGTVLRVDGAVGAPVEAGQTLVVLEAMKMELALQAPFDGALERLDVAAGQRVALGAPLFSVRRAG